MLTFVSIVAFLWARTPYGRGWLRFGPLIHSNGPLRPAAADREGGQSERHRVSPPHARSWLCPHLPIDTHCTHVRAGLLLLRASVPRPRLAAPFPLPIPVPFPLFLVVTQGASLPLRSSPFLLLAVAAAP